MVMEAVSLICKLFGALVLAVDAAPYFRWGDARQHCVYELAMCGTGPDRTAILRHGET